MTQSERRIDLNASFSDIASKSLFFIDKSVDASKLLYLSSRRILILRPPQFGKSIIMDIIEDILTGKKDNFEALNCKILSTINFANMKKFSVIRFKLTSPFMTPSNYNEIILNEIKKSYERSAHVFSYDFKFTSPSIALNHVISKLSENNKIVVLIDDIQSILVGLNRHSKEFKTIHATIQSIFDVLIKWRDSIEYSLLLGTANFFDLTDFAADFTFSPEVAEIFGFNQDNIINLNIFNNQVAFSDVLPQKKIAYFGGYQQHLQKIYDNCFSNFDSIITHKLTGQIRVDFLFHLILHFGGYRFSPYSKESVISPIEFILSIYKSKIESYWLQKVFPNANDLITPLQGFIRIRELLESVLPLILFNDQSISKNDFILFKALIPFGLLSFDCQNIVIPNLALFDFFTNIVIENSVQKKILYSPRLKQPAFKNIIEEFPLFLQSYMPPLLQRNNCWDFLFFTFCRFYFSLKNVQVANDSSFLIFTNNSLIISLTSHEDIGHRLSMIGNETNGDIAVVKIYVNAFVNIESAYRIRNCKGLAKSQFLNQNSVIKRKEDSTDTKLMSFCDLVRLSLNELSQKQKNGITASEILTDLIRKRPQFASLPTLDKSITLSLYYLYEQKKVNYYNRNGVTVYVPNQ